MSVGQLTLSELHQELLRRIRKLQDERTALVERIQAIDEELGSLPNVEKPDALPDAPEPGSRRGRTRQSRAASTRKLNKRPLHEVLTEVLGPAPLTTREAADASIEAGYITSSRNFPNTVYVTLHKDDRFTKTDDGKWTLAG